MTGDAIAEQLFATIVRDLGTAKALLSDALITDDWKRVRQARENVRSTLESLEALGKRLP